MLGGGRQQFLDSASLDPTTKDYSCARRDGKNLISYWADEKFARNASFKYVQNTEELLSQNMRGVDYLLGRDQFVIQSLNIIDLYTVFI
jgi:alkaline phosphatase